MSMYQPEFGFEGQTNQTSNEGGDSNIINQKVEKKEKSEIKTKKSETVVKLEDDGLGWECPQCELIGRTCPRCKSK